MKATVMREYLKEGLGIVERATSKTASLPVLQHVFVSLGKNKVKMAGTDLQIGVTCEFLADVKEEGEAVVTPRFITPLLHIVTENQVTLQGDGKQIAVHAGDFHATLQTAGAEEFPIIPSLKGESSFVEVQTPAFCKGLSQVVGMAGQSQARPEIGGVLFVFEREVLRLVATDSFRLAEKKLALDKPNTGEQTFILPQKTAREVIAILAEKQGTTTIHGSPSQVVFDYDGKQEAFPAHIQIVSRLIEGEYPDYQNVIPKEHKTKAVFPKEELVNHIKAASVFAGKTNEVALSVDPAKGGVSFVAKNNEAGENQSFLPTRAVGQKVDIAFNWRFLLDGLLQLRAGQVELALNGEDGPALLRGDAQEGYLYVIMPIKA